MYPNQYYSSSSSNNANANANNHHHHHHHHHHNNTDNSASSFSSQGGYPHQIQPQDNQDTQGSISLSYPYGSYSYQQGTSAHHQQQEYANWNMQQQYGTPSTMQPPPPPPPPPPSHQQQHQQHQQPTYNSHRPHVHDWVEVPNTTTPRAMEPFIIETVDQGMKRFRCGWSGCTHSAGFVRKAQLVTHIRSVHLSERPFLCTTCDTSFTRRQDAARHVDTMNSGRQFRCHYCEEGFARRDYRDRHSERCRYRR